MKISIIGIGFTGLSTVAILAQEGYAVHVFKKNNQIGGG